MEKREFRRVGDGELRRWGVSLRREKSVDGKVGFGV